MVPGLDIVFFTIKYILNSVSVSVVCTELEFPSFPSLVSFPNPVSKSQSKIQNPCLPVGYAGLLSNIRRMSAEYTTGSGDLGLGFGNGIGYRI